MGRINSTKFDPTKVGKLVRDTRRALGYTQKQVAAVAGTGLRFIIELEKGKPTCEVAKVLSVVNTLGIKVTMTMPNKALENLEKKKKNKS